MASSYVTDDQGTFIPASQRPDGSWRKPRRVKDGYVPQEEVPLYESKGKQFVKNQPKYPVGMSPEFVAEHKAKKEIEINKSNPIPGLIITETKKKKKKNKNKSVTEVTESLSNASISQTTAKKPQNNTPKQKVDKAKSTNNLPVSGTEEKQLSTVDPLKRLKNLRKKLKEIESLDSKIKTGEIKNPDKEMINKVSKKAEILREVKELEANQ